MSLFEAEITRSGGSGVRASGLDGSALKRAFGEIGFQKSPVWNLAKTLSLTLSVSFSPFVGCKHLTCL